MAAHEVGGAVALAREDEVAQVLASRTAPGVDCVALPGQLEHERAAAARRDGVPLDATGLADLERVAAEVGVDLPAR